MVQGIEAGDGRFVVLRCAVLYDGAAETPIENAALLLRGTKIVAVGRRDELAIPAEKVAEVWDFGEACALPGLVDEHTHLSLPGDGRTYEQMMLDSDDLMALVGARNLGLHLRSGVTTLRDHGARNRVGFALKEALRRGYLSAPRALFSGRSITCTGGHFHFLNAVADGPEAIRHAVRQLVHEGADYIKIMASGGGTAGTLPGYASYTEAELRAAAEEAHRFGKLIVAHCRATAAMLNAARAGIDLLEHAQFTEPDLTSRFEPRVAEALLQSGAYVSPTLQAGTQYSALLRLRQTQAAGQLSRQEKEQLAWNEGCLEERMGIFRQLLAFGFAERIVAGSDAGCFDFTFGHLQYDVELMVAGGLSPRQAIQAATSVAARAIGLGDTVGSLTPGKEADVLLVAGNPLANIADLEQVIAVIKGGVRVV